MLSTNVMRILLTGGSGYIGQSLIQRLSTAKDPGSYEVVITDCRPPSRPLPAGMTFQPWDVRQAADPSVSGQSFDLICNFAAVHREPGHSAHEYFDTNLAGARHVCELARQTNCPRILFTSSIAVYGPTTTATDEFAPTYPATPYGISKLVAEGIHREWAAEDRSRKLIICRPGVVYGPGDPGNILRMIRAVRRGVFFFPGNPAITKSYAFIEGLLDSFVFAQEQPDRVFTYNYVEYPTEPLNRLVQIIGKTLNRSSRTFPLPLGLLIPVARLVQWASRGRSPIHPDRVRKAATATHIVPRQLIDRGFSFNFDFATSLAHWKSKAPSDFGDG